MFLASSQFVQKQLLLLCRTLLGWLGIGLLWFLLFFFLCVVSFCHIFIFCFVFCLGEKLTLFFDNFCIFFTCVFSTIPTPCPHIPFRAYPKIHHLFYYSIEFQWFYCGFVQEESQCRINLDWILHSRLSILFQLDFPFAVIGCSIWNVGILQIRNSCFWIVRISFQMWDVQYRQRTQSAIIVRFDGTKMSNAISPNMISIGVILVIGK